MKLAVISNMVDPNRTGVLSLVAEEPSCDLLVVYETAMEANRKWSPPPDLPFRYTILRSRSVDLLPLGTDAYLHLPLRPLEPLRAFRPDVVVAAGGGVWSSPANIAALAGRHRGGWAFVPWWASFSRPQPTRARRLAEPWVRTFVGAGDAWIAYGTRAAREVVRLGADNARTTIVPNVARNQPLDSSGTQRRDGAPRYLYVGQLVERKGVRVLLEAFAGIPEGELYVAGDGPLRWLVDAAAAKDHRIRVLGHTPWNQLDELYRSADALVLPSLYEVWGLVVNEALARGLSVVVSDQVGAADDLVEHGVTGLIVPAGSAEDLRAAMDEVGSLDGPRRARAAAAALETMRGWSKETAAARLLAACEIALAHRRRPTRNAA